MNELLLIELFNKIYEADGFDGLLHEVNNMLKYGSADKISKGLYRVTTGGWSDDEAILHCLIDYRSRLHYHYKGYIVGGAFYFHKNKKAQCEITEVNE